MTTKTTHTGRKLTTEEVKAMLLRDAKREDKKNKLVRYDWDKSIKSVLWNSNCGIPHDKTCVDVHIEGRSRHYVVYDERTQENVVLSQSQITSEEINAGWWLRSKPSISGLSMFDLESLVIEMEEVGVIKALLNAGFTLNIIIPSRVFQ